MGGSVSMEMAADPSMTRRSPPHALGHPVRPPQTGGQGGGVERAGGAGHVEPVGQLGPVTQRAVEGLAEAAGPPGIGRHPRPILERRPVANVLVVQTRQLRHPVPHVILVKPDDLAPHPTPLRP